MAIDDLYELRLSYHQPDAEVTLGFGYKQTVGTNDKDTLQSAVEFFNANFLSFFLNAFAVDVEVDQIRMDPVTPNNDIPGFVNLVGIPGVVLGQAIPSGGAAVLSWVTDAPNSKHNGRTYLAGVSEDEVINGTITPAQSGVHILLIGQMLTTLRTSLPQTAEFEFATISKVLNGAPRVPPVAFDVLSGVARLPFFSQRRRITSRLGNS